jgi:hypothetical protein
MNFGDSRLPDRFWSKCIPEPNSVCWLWLGAVTQQGYGRISVGNRRCVMAYRFAFEHAVGPIPNGLDLDHLCRNGYCVNPAHLEPVTHRENMLRGDTFAARQSRVTHCPRGHAYDSINTRTRRGKRECRTCARELNRAKRSR